MIKSIRALLAPMVFAAFVFSTSSAFAEDVKVPQTVADHDALAKSYKDQATQYRKTADDHKKMAEAYAKTYPDSKSGKNAWTVKMQRHCQALTKNAEKMAVDADKAADYHTFRAKELQGK